MNETIKQPETVLIFVDILNDRYLQWIDVNTYEFGWTDTLGQASVFQPDQEQSILQAIARIETGEAWITPATLRHSLMTTYRRLRSSPTTGTQRAFPPIRITGRAKGFDSPSILKPLKPFTTMAKKKSNWVELELSYCPVKIAYRVIKGNPKPELKVVIRTHVPKQHYYSYLNDAITESYEHYEQSHTN